MPRPVVDLHFGGGEEAKATVSKRGHASMTPPTDADPPAALVERFRRYRRTGERSLRNALVVEHRWIALQCAARFAHRSEPMTDLVQVAQVGLLKAVERFDPERGNAFSTFAFPTVLGELRRHFRDRTWALHVPRGQKDRCLQLQAVRQTLIQRLGRMPTVDELAQEMGVAVEDVLGAFEASSAYRTTSTDGRRATGDDGDDSTAFSRRFHCDSVNIADQRLDASRALSRLPTRKQQAILLRFYEGLSQAEVGARMGLSQVHVSRLLGSALRQLRSLLQDTAA